MDEIDERWTVCMYGLGKKTMEASLEGFGYLVGSQLVHAKGVSIWVHHVNLIHELHGQDAGGRAGGYQWKIQDSQRLP